MDVSPTDDFRQPRTRDLGGIGKPVLICGGAYSNLQALTALFDAAAGLGIPPERIIHTGDVVAYCADPLETSRLLRGKNVPAIQGNVEESLWASAPDCGCGFEQGTECEKLSAAWFAHADAQADADLRHWMGALPHQITFIMAGRRVRVIHGGVSSINRYIFASSPAGTYKEEFEAADADIILAGHSGLPYTREIGGRVWHNSGALGMPANDGTPRAWYSLMIPDDAAIRFEHRPLDYDHEAARERMIAAGLPGGYADALVTGLWPSLDILPAEEKSRTGLQLDPDRLGAALAVRKTSLANG